ncbi:hypothetical protein ACWT_1912 [Actinoplanes sp. SE50]|uniref:Rv1733c family protein n=1 Tax=unclassified Actinoplanes TaxID=2626549 RepID=UPI00023EBEB5|nr:MULTISPECIES: hypothetical protein [unclassified Actinoplanes]AEV82931.1 hypothetical protein ACPL_2034 [Actinoplanes sp. SE50/110]ATO81327.1 hypothetical protein ACWT_1912 [Actinoplanes sp. SE50]SLL98734.1 hypothetical protein ACSP50_1961 [Actinoplanes sp. SE50/110]
MIARRLGWERNLLRRTSDRVESLVMFVLVLTFLAGAPLLAWWAGAASYRADVRARDWERAHVFQVDAVLVEDSGTYGAIGTRTAAPQAARATWIAPDGTAHSGLVQTPTEVHAGARIAIWVDDTGRLQAPPLRHSPTSQGILVALCAILCLAAFLAGLHRTTRALLDRHRCASWAREWRVVGPRWSRDPRWRRRR